MGCERLVILMFGQIYFVEMQVGFVLLAAAIMLVTWTLCGFCPITARRLEADVAIFVFWYAIIKIR